MTVIVIVSQDMQKILVQINAKVILKKINLVCIQTCKTCLGSTDTCTTCDPL